MGIYQDHVMGTTAGNADATPYDDDVKRPMSDATRAIKKQHHNKDFAAHFDINDASPAGSKNGTAREQPIVDNHKATKSNWSLYETAPETRGGINIAGNGMGSRKTNEAAFSLFDESSPARKENAPIPGKQSAPRGVRTEGDGDGSSGINIAGNGMGSRKTNEAAFSLFDESPAKERNSILANKQSTTQGKRFESDGMGGKKGGESFWDF
jgi:hypothetical protein